VDLIVAGIAVAIYARRKKIPFLHLADATAPGLILAYGIGRIGCHVSGDGDWGIVNTAEKPGWLSWLPDWAWSYDYPNNVGAISGFRWQHLWHADYRRSLLRGLLYAFGTLCIPYSDLRNSHGRNDFRTFVVFA
jgi:hypothetical protein